MSDKDKKFQLVRMPGQKKADKGVLNFIRALLGLKKVGVKPYKPTTYKPRKPTPMR